MCYAVALRKNIDSLVKGMILSDQGGGRGEKIMDEIGAPVSLWSACFLLLFAQRIVSDIFAGSKILVGNSSAGPPSVMLAENVLFLSEIHRSSSNIFFHPISLDSKDSCCSTPDMLRRSRYCRDSKILDDKLS